MKPTCFDYKKSLIRRRIWISSVFIFIGILGLGLDGLSLSYSTGLYIFVAGFYAYRVIRDVILLFRSAPAVTISDEGIQDAHFGNVLIPWTAITEIKTSSPGKSFGSMIVLIAEASQIETSPGPLPVRFANWVIGANSQKENKQMALPMTVTVALDATLDHLLDAIRTHSPVPIEIRDTSTA